MVEDMPRLALFLLFLRAHPNICIHVRIRNLHTDYLFRALGLDPTVLLLVMLMVSLSTCLGRRLVIS